MKKPPHYKQSDQKDCGPTCLKIVAKHFGKTIAIQVLRKLTETTRAGSSLLGLSEAAEKLGFRSLGVKISLEKLLEAPLPCILHWNKNHYVVLHSITNSKLRITNLGDRAKNKPVFHISDPAHGLLKYNQTAFIKHWIGNNANENTEEGVALLVEPTPKFLLSPTLSEGKGAEKSLGFSFFIQIFISVQKISCTNNYWFTGWKFITAYFSFFNAEYCRCRYKESRYSFYLFNTFRTVSIIFRKNSSRNYTRLDSFAFKHTY